ncbi:synaptotagmin 1-like isoform X1 [Oncorhynchus keta]|uniref:synaptotagmin 1-like isoform X1 n=2 Tax=Oncorhynchus keta TaxID=8018 RepID=UPI0015FE4F3A|nr:synaptotagmin 1-like isoform X1 [Oncorhynchus keta]
MGFRWQRDMRVLPTVDLSIGDLRMPFNEEVKYCILGISVTLFLIAMGILVWQLYRYCSQAPKEPVDNLLSSDGKPAKTEDLYMETQRPNFKVEKLHEEAQRLSRCLYMGSHMELPGLGNQLKGSLRFSLYYDQLQSRLVVTVLEARGLPVRDFSRSVDPFVRVRLLWAKHDNEEEKEEQSSPSLQCVLHEWQSRMVKDSSSPTFGDQFSCSMEEEDVPHTTVRFEVRDFDKFSRHGLLGEVRVSLCDMNISYPLEVLEDLQTPQKDMVGEVLLSLKYLHTLQRLEVGLLKIRALSQQSEKDKVRLYARISVLCNQFKLRHQKSTAKTLCEVTVFNEVMMFTLPDPQIRACCIVVSVYKINAARKSSKCLVGQVTFGKGKRSEEEHWCLMMRSFCQPIAKWHPLLI